MDKDKKVWIIGGVLIGAGTLYLAYKQYKVSQENAASSAASSDALMQALMTQPLTGGGYAYQPSGYSGPSASTGNSAFQNVLTSILGSGASSSDSGTTSSTGTGTSSGNSSTPSTTPITSRYVSNQPGSAINVPSPVGPAGDFHIGGNYGVNIGSQGAVTTLQPPSITIMSPNFKTIATPGMIQ